MQNIVLHYSQLGAPHTRGSASRESSGTCPGDSSVDGWPESGVVIKLL